MFQDTNSQDLDQKISRHVIKVHKNQLDKEKDLAQGLSEFKFLKQYIKFERQLRPILTKSADNLINSFLC